MANRLTKMSIDVGDEQVVLERIEALEALSRPFNILCDIISPLEIDLQPHLGKPAALSVLEDDQVLRHFHGLVVSTEYDKESNDGHHYRLTLQPWTYYLGQNRDIAIYQDQTAVDIIKKVIEKAGFSDVDYSRLSKQRQQRVYTVQYRESDLHFISRLMEEEGIYYFFQHNDDRHVMVFCEGPSCHQPGTPASLDYNPNSVSVFNTDSDDRFGSGQKYFLQSWTEHVSSGGESKVTYRDFDFYSPDQPLSADHTMPSQHPHDDREVFHYPGRYQKDSTGRGDQEQYGTDRSQTKLEGLRANRRRFAGTSQAAGLTVGMLMSVENHPASRMNGSHLITSTYHSIAAETYRSGSKGTEMAFNVRLDAIPADTTFSAPPSTPKPIVHGLESATVTGPAGETIYTDEFGRIKIRFHWDRADTPGENSTCWVRVSQTGGLGNIILPRVGHEVLVDFLNGDPDRPLVVGRLFNKSHMPTYDLPANKTRAVWRTLTYGQTGQYPDTMPLPSGTPSSNEIRLEDKGGSEEVYIHAERLMTTHVRFDETHLVGHDKTRTIGHDHTHTVGRDESHKIGRDQTIGVIRNRTSTINQVDKLHVGDTLEIDAQKKIVITVQKSSITIEPGGITIHAPAITIQGDTKVQVNGVELHLNGSGQTNINGGLVNVNTVA